MSTAFVRFAPSPTGLLHVGNIRIALINWLFARSVNGKFLLRIDDTDTERSKKEYVDQIKEDLNWLGLTWDDLKFQSERSARYQECKNLLINSGRLYPCYEKKEELELRKKLLLKSGKPPIYSREALKLSKDQKLKLEKEGRKPHWRFLLDHSKKIVLQDEIKGEITFEPSKISDPVLIREDGTMTYILASVVDDIDFGITHIIRGEDHLTGSAIHANLFEALGSSKLPRFAHISLMRSKEDGISKRKGGGFDIKSLRDAGIESISILNLLAKLGTSDEVDPFNKIQDLISGFSFEKFSGSQVIYNKQDLLKINEKLVHNMDYEDALPKVKEMGFSIDKEIWDAGKGNISNIKDILVLQKICQENLKPKIVDLEYTKKVSEILPEEPWGLETWQQLVSIIKNTLNKKGKELFMPLRLALTGSEDGPELQKLLPLIGRKRCYERLRGKEG